MPSAPRLAAPLLLALLLAPAAARAEGDPPCAPPARAWAAACAAAEHFTVELRRCNPDHATFRVDKGKSPYQIEINRRSDGFRRAGGFSVSPIGEFEDWSKTPKPMQEALDGVVRCVERGLGDEVFNGAAPTDSPSATPTAAPAPTSAPKASSPAPETRAAGPALPWRLFGALLAIAAVASTFARARGRRRSILNAAALLALFAAAFAFHHFAFPAAFFHQNGHGALWIDYALGQYCSYGPGFHQLFSRAAALDPAAAERPVFFAQALLGATAPISILLLARTAGAPRAIAIAMALVALIDPSLGRLARSESYYGVTAWLLLAAAALLATGARLGRVRAPAFLAAVLGAGLLVAQAALVHPVCWSPAALIPIAALVGPGALKRRIRLAVTAGIGIGVLVVATAGPAMLQTYANESRWGGQFAATMLGRIPNYRAPFLAVIATLVVTFALGRVPRLRRSGLPQRLFRLALRLALFGAVVVVGRLLDSMSMISPWLARAWWSLLLPGLAASAAAALAFLPRDRRLAIAAGALLLIAGIAFSRERWSDVTRLPTDSLEAREATDWRPTLGENAYVVYLGRAEKRIAELPLYRCCDPRRLRVVRLVSDEPEQYAGLRSGPNAFYYRSSLCSSAEGRPFCDDLERRLTLEPVDTATLPAVPSMPRMTYDRASIEVGLYRIKAVAQAASPILD